MKYWNEYHKLGFDDGASVPPDVDQVRKVQCEVLNKVAEKLGSNCRARPFNRTGVHNMYIVLVISKEAYDAWNKDPFSPTDSDMDFIDHDSEWHKALDITNEILEYIEPDIVITDVVLDQGKLNQVLNKIDDKSIFEEIDPYFMN